jgi:phosphohistidine phosphatase
MKRLLMVRHAKSDWSDLSLKDFDRPLNKRGKENAPTMGKRLRNRHYYVDLILSSSSQRTKGTTKRIAKEINYDEKNVVWLDELYHANTNKIKQVIYGINDKHDSVMVVCHNTGITDFVNSFCGYITDNLPTCGMVAFQFDTDSWNKIDTAPAKLIFFDFPRSRE